MEGNALDMTSLLALDIQDTKVDTTASTTSLSTSPSDPLHGEVCHDQSQFDEDIYAGCLCGYCTECQEGDTACGGNCQYAVNVGETDQVYPKPSLLLVTAQTPPLAEKATNQPSFLPVVLDKTFGLYAITPFIMIISKSDKSQPTSPHLRELEEVTSKFLRSIFSDESGVANSVYITTLKASTVSRGEYTSS